MDDIFNNRVLSSFPVSVGTGLMLESLFKTTETRIDNDRVIPNIINPDDYSYHIYNIHTIIRNILNSVNSKDTFETIKHKKFTGVLLDEIYVLKSIYEQSKCKLLLFEPNYTTPYEKMNLNKSLENNHYLEYDIVNKWLLASKLKYPVDKIHNTYKLPKIGDNNLITTSYPIDLLNTNLKLSLLESHTGKLKNKWLWYTKYHVIGNKDLSVFPFMEELMYVLGDTRLVKTASLGLRYKLHDIAVRSNWTARTTRDKVMSDIKKDHELNEYMSKYKKIY